MKTNVYLVEWIITCRIFIQLNSADENELTKTAQTNMDECHKYNDELKKPDTKGGILGDFIEIGVQH